ncbi:cell division protein ZapA [Rhizobiales bacterium TNE-4]|nr:cell division protein ZapA [Rhizobiales bacterium TNE-4]MBV1827879.1 cell division protein ZapA [Rhizobiales bacterium TNE-4]
MAQVTVTIAGKIFRIACDDGQEPHLESLAHELDGRIGDMRKAFGEIGDNRLTVMAAISFLDEREDVKLRVAELEAELADLRARTERIDAMVAESEDEIAKALNDVAAKLETLARG